jgi:hypothetical protein
MRIIIVLTALLLPAVAAFCQPYDCSRFREGRFRVADSRLGAITITERNGDYQTESSEALKAILRFRIRWQDNCAYTLRLDKVIRNENRIDFPSGLEVHVRIIETTESSYTQETTSPLTNETYTTMVTRIN